MRQRIFWTVYFVDRRISLSCGRPYSIREADIEIEQPAYLCDKVRISENISFVISDPGSGYSPRPAFTRCRCISIVKCVSVLHGLLGSFCI